MKKEHYISLFKGMLLGFVFPLALVGVVYLIFQMNSKDFNENVASSLILFGLGINTLIARVIFKQEKEFLGRGVIFTTFIYVIYWVFKYQMDT